VKYVVIILDGASGWPIAELGGKTTLEAASTPHLDALARSGLVGLAQTVPEGAEPSSAAACTSILGYDPVADFVGRGAIEAASMGIDLAPDEVALRLNLVHIANDVMVSYACGHIATPESRAIVSDLAAALDDTTFRLYPGVAYRHILVVKGEPDVLHGTYMPPHDISDKPASPHLPSGPGSEVLRDYMDRAREVLKSSPANQQRADSGGMRATDVWPFWPGVRPSGMIPFAEKRKTRAALTSGVDLLNGLAVLAGMDRLHIAGVTDGPDTDYAAQAAGALAALDDHDLVVIHVESPDEEGHAGSVPGKKAAIEAIDKHIVKAVRSCAEELRVLAMPDHPTPTELKTHVGEPVPFVLWGPGIGPNGASSYGEVAAAETGLVVDPGREVMDLLLG